MNMQRGEEIQLDRSIPTSNDQHRECLVTYEGANTDGMLTFWCPKHQGWVYVWPIAKTYHYPGFPDLRR